MRRLRGVERACVGVGAGRAWAVRWRGACAGAWRVRRRVARAPAGPGARSPCYADGGGQYSARGASESPLTIRAMAQPSNSPAGSNVIFARGPGVARFGA